MKKLIVSILVILVSIATAQAGGFTVTSTQVTEGKIISNTHVLNGFGCEGSNVSPSLSWKNPPVGTKSFAVTVYDPDAPTGSGWWHWVSFNIPANTHSLPSGAGNTRAGLMPSGSVQSRTDFGKPGYGGPCPPAGDKPHRYQFTVYALGIDKLPLDETAPAAMVGFYIHQNLLGKAMFEASYGR